ncbi:MAG: hypothetical protein ACR2OO_04410 [Thermomicrobiales bacterium]
MGDKSQTGGVGDFSDLEYDLLTTLGNLLQGSAVLTEYAEDAEEAGDLEAAEIFRVIQANNLDSARRVRSALARVLNAK